jgi:preprotein translocase subunit SecG
MNLAELLVPFFNVLYVVIAIVMTALILMQRGAGAQAGSSFGAGASGTVFGAQGSANFLSRSTAVCAILFFVISFGMGVYISHGGREKLATKSLMSDMETPAAEVAPVKPAAPAGELPAVPGPGTTGTAAPAPNVSGAPASAPATNAPAAITPVTPTPQAESTAPVQSPPTGSTPNQ